MDISNFERVQFNTSRYDENWSPIYDFYLKDPKTGDLYTRQLISPYWSGEDPVESVGNLVATGKALNDPEIQLLNTASSDPARAQYFYDLKQNNPKQYYGEVAQDLSNTIFTSYINNSYGSSKPQRDLLESIKEKDPEAYYTEKFNLLSKQAGWQHGQNTFERAKPYQDEIQRLAPEAYQAGLSAERINQLVGGGFSAATTQNQQRIANQAAQGSFLQNLVRGVAPIAALAIGAPFLDAALSGGTAAATAGTAGTAGTVGAQTGNAMLASLGLGAEAALPYTAAAGLPANLFTLAPSAAGFVGLTPEFAAELGLSGGSGLSSAGASGNVLAGIYGAGEGAAFGMSDELAAELGLSGGSGLDTAGAAGDPLAGIYGASKPLITPGQAIQALRMGGSLLSGGQPQPQQQPQMMGAMNRMPQGAVDYSGIYNLLGLQRPQNRLSLLG